MYRRPMGKRARTKDELLADRSGSPVALRERSEGRNLHDRVLRLQRDYGNNAVAAMVVQRKGAKPGKGGKGGKGGTKKPPEDYLKGIPHYNGTADQQKSLAMDYWQGKNGVSMDLEKAAKYMQGAWFHTADDGQARAIALNISRIWKEWSEPERAAFWMKVHTGEINPRADGSKRHA